MELEVMELTAEEVKLVECYRAMTVSDQKVCLFLAARFSSQPVSSSSLPNNIFKGNKKQVVFQVGDNSSHNSLTNIQTLK